MNSTMIDQQTISDKAYLAITELVFKRKLKPGDRLIETKLANDLGISRTPLREAITRLSQDGFFVTEPRKGTYVRDFQIEDVIEVYDIRIALEGLAARLSVEHLNANDLKKIKERFLIGDIADLPEIDSSLHSLFIKHSGNKRLVCILGNIYNLTQMLRILGYASTVKSQQATSDHIQIIEALLKKDADLASSLVVEHITKTKESIISKLLSRENAEQAQ